MSEALGYIVTNDDIIEDEIDALIVMAELTGYTVIKNVSHDAITVSYNFCRDGAAVYQLNVSYAIKDTGNTVYNVWFNKKKENLMVSSSATESNDLIFPINVLKMVL